MIRKAALADIDAITSIYDHTHTAEESGEAAIGCDIVIHKTSKLLQNTTKICTFFQKIIDKGFD